MKGFYMGFLKKRLSLIKLQSLMLCVILAASLFAFTGCQGNVQNNGKINIVCTTYPQYNWIQNIIGEESEEFKKRKYPSPGISSFFAFNFQGDPLPRILSTSPIYLCHDFLQISYMDKSLPANHRFNRCQGSTD